MNRNKAFTLIELLVVIAIIALLLGILIPSLRLAKEQARKIVCASHANNIGTAVRAYLSEYDDRFRNVANNGLWEDMVTHEPLEYDDPGAYWGVCYSEYTDGQKVFNCPSMMYPDMWYLPWEYNAGKTRAELFPIFKYCSLGLNSYICYDYSVKDQWRKMSDFKSPSTVIFAQDHVEQKLDGIGSDMLCAAPNSFLNLHQWRGYTRDHPDLYPNSLAECFRHGRSSYMEGEGLCNTIWLDGHYSAIKQDDGPNIPKHWYDTFRIDH